ncbi:hypothetical protein GGQ22_02730 [Nocardioides sp. zg-579]|uniref:ARG and Rhodanese-Phosphatase-superfamily-associated domain-containing protein n=1 Tax=Nocardioides marmotae TaxID=2663857 RepID=A0A6I3J9E8_9ACTN|nr:DUF6569 family protein [Nocardioides marmotae]MCR6030354.1 hypothetical protein [Gordonia jinghuaiqii]MTB93988.1 hypothetical protein [Nocardioides marmotae]QKE00303.1 hypothetical protein HPC71_03810 [Nocardioides marmotae]
MRLHIGQGTTVGSLTVFPVWHDRVATKRRYETSAETLSIAELGGGPSVPQLSVTNTGQQDVLVLDGQLFEGGWQHRMATRSVMVAAGQERVIDVACVEQQRWGGEHRQVSRGRRASSYVRDGFEQPGRQQEVWRRIERYGAASATRSHTAHLDAVEEQTRLVRTQCRPLAGQCGVLVGVAGQPLVLEVFDHPQTLREQLPAILRSAALDGYGRACLPTPGRRARRMLERHARTGLDWEPDVGQASRLGRATTDDLDVMALRQSLRTVHLRATYRRHPVLQG